MSAAGMHGTRSTSTGSYGRGQTGRPGGDASGTDSTESRSSYTARVDTSSLSGIEAASRRPATNDSGGTTADNLASSPTTAEQLASSPSVLDSLTPQSRRPRPSEPANQTDYRTLPTPIPQQQTILRRNCPIMMLGTVCLQLLATMRKSRIIPRRQRPHRLPAINKSITMKPLPRHRQ